MATKSFRVEAVLTAATGRLACEMGECYEILNWMTNDNLFTHQLPRAMNECKPWLLRWFPTLNAARESLWVLDEKIKELGPAKGCAFWVTNLQLNGLPAMFDVPRIPRDDHEFKDPITEAVEIVGADKVLVVGK